MFIFLCYFLCNTRKMNTGAEREFPRQSNYLDQFTWHQSLHTFHANIFGRQEEESLVGTMVFDAFP